MINSCAMKGVNHRKKAAVVKKNQRENSQVCVLCCATDRDWCCQTSRERPLQQVPSTLQTADLGKAFLHHQEPGRISNLARKFFPNKAKGSFPLQELDMIYSLAAKQQNTSAWPT